MSDNNYQEYVDLLKLSSDYPKMILKLSEAIPSYFAEIRNTFLTAIAKELREKFGFQDDVETYSDYNNEIWHTNLKKGEKCLHFCYETNFFFRTDKGDKWQYLKSDVFNLQSENTNYLSRKSGEAFNLKRLDRSSFGLLDWFYQSEENQKKLISRCALAGNEFFENN